MGRQGEPARTEPRPTRSLALPGASPYPEPCPTRSLNAVACVRLKFKKTITRNIPANMNAMLNITPVSGVLPRDEAAAINSGTTKSERERETRARLDLGAALASPRCTDASGGCRSVRGILSAWCRRFRWRFAFLHVQPMNCSVARVRLN
jgi:hypothetical protein